MDNLMAEAGRDALAEAEAIKAQDARPKLYDLEFKMGMVTPGLAESFQEVQNEQYMLFLRKNLDYGSKNITAGLSPKNEDEVKFVLNGLWYRVADKVNRWQNLLMKGEANVDESLLDIFQDIANYCTIATLVKTGNWKS